MGITLINSTGAFQYINISEGFVNDGAWHHIAFTARNGINGSVYSDGVLRNQTSFASEVFTPSPVNLTMGIEQSHGTDNWGHLNATLDEVMIWNRSLTNAEINQTMSGVLPNYPNDLIGYWNFDGGIVTCPSDFSRVVVTTNCGGVSAEFTKPPKCR